MNADAIVVGAGAAGLAAARYLAGQSLRVILLEARNRTGGRVWSIPSESSSAPAELGAEFIHGPARETRALLRDAGAAAVDLGGESWTQGTNGELRCEDDKFMIAASIFEQAGELPSDETVDTFLQRFGNDGAMREKAAAARAFVEGFEAADPSIASVRAIADEWRTGVDSTTARPVGGYVPMFAQLSRGAAEAGVRSCLSTVVHRVAWHRGEVSVDATSSRGESQTFRARAAILTVPAGVLRCSGEEGAVVFAPELPAAKREALAKIEMGHAVKVVLRFRTAFWERVREGRYRDAAFFRTHELPFVAFWTQLPLRSDLIVAWTAGPKTTALSALSRSERIDLALANFGGLLGESALARKEFQTGATHDWSGDPLARGAYSYVAAGGGDARNRLAEPVDDTLFFAGEATSNDGQGGTVNGALETGERAARELVASLAKS